MVLCFGRLLLEALRTRGSLEAIPWLFLGPKIASFVRGQPDQAKSGLSLVQFGMDTHNWMVSILNGQTMHIVWQISSSRQYFRYA
jgi:hypothetical protein